MHILLVVLNEERIVSLTLVQNKTMHKKATDSIIEGPSNYLAIFSMVGSTISSCHVLG
jgi:hypothetical protein